MFSWFTLNVMIVRQFCSFFCCKRLSFCSDNLSQFYQKFNPSNLKANLTYITQYTVKDEVIKICGFFFESQERQPSLRWIKFGFNSFRRFFVVNFSLNKKKSSAIHVGPPYLLNWTLFSTSFSALSFPHSSAFRDLSWWWFDIVLQQLMKA